MSDSLCVGAMYLGEAGGAHGLICCCYGTAPDDELECATMAMQVVHWNLVKSGTAASWEDPVCAVLVQKAGPRVVTHNCNKDRTKTCLDAMAGAEYCQEINFQDSILDNEKTAIHPRLKQILATVAEDFRTLQGAGRTADP